MATIGNKVMTLADHAKTFGVGSKEAMIVEMLSQKNAILEDMPFREGNLTTGHRTTIRTGLPDVYWRNFNQGIPASKSSKATVDEKCAMMEAFSECDIRLAKLDGNEKAYRLSEAKAFLHAMSNEHAQTMFYGNSATAPAEFTGLAARFSSSTAENGRNIIKAGGTGSDNSSIWMMCLGEESIHGIFPKGTKAGIDHQDLGAETREFQDGAGTNIMRVYRDQFTLDTGLVVKDWRYVARICNIDVSDLNTGSAADLVNLMIKAYHRIEDINYGKAVIYMNRSIKQYLDIQRTEGVRNMGLDYDLVDGKPVVSFRGIPIKTVDAILDTEAVVA